MKYLGEGGPRPPLTPRRPPISKKPLDPGIAPPTHDLARVPVVVFGVLLVGFWPTFASFPRAWDAPSHEHGWIVALFVFWLLWRDRHRLLGGDTGGLMDVTPVLAFLSVGWLMCLIAGIGTGHEALMPIILALWAVATLGWATRWVVGRIALTFMLAVPLWAVVIPPLQRATTVASGAITRLAGIEAEVGYDTITLNAGTFLVEAGCSGLNYLMGALVLGAMYAQLFLTRWQTQVKVVALAGVAAIIGNWIRVTMLIVIGEVSAMESGLLEDHLWQGWLIFTVLMIPTYFVAGWIERRDRVRYAGRAPQNEAARATTADTDPSGVDLNPKIEGVRPAGADRGGRNRRAVLAGFAAIVGPMTYMVVGAVPRSAALDRDVEALHTVSPWVARSIPAAELNWLPGYRGVDERVAWTLSAGDVALEGARHYYRDQSFGEELIQYGNTIAADSLIYSDRMVGPVGPERRLAREAVVVDRGGARVVWYWYRVGGYETAFGVKAKLLEIVSFFRRSPAAELVTLTGPCEGDDCSGAAAAIRSAMGVPVSSPEESAR